MPYREVLYDINSIWIALALFVIILVANEAAYRFAKLPNIKRDEGVTSQTNAIQGGTLGLLALLLGFSFNMALQRFDARSASVVDEANAIGTAWLRADLYTEPHRGELKNLLSNYVDLRVAARQITLTDTGRYKEMVAQTTQMQAEIWNAATRGAEAGAAAPPAANLVFQSLNEMIDSYGSRQAQLQKHVPELVLMLMFLIFIVSGSLLGFAAGLGGSRPTVATISMALLIVLVIFIVIDLDRPRRGLIQVDQESLVALQGQLR